MTNKRARLIALGMALVALGWWLFPWALGGSSTAPTGSDSASSKRASASASAPRSTPTAAAPAGSTAAPACGLHYYANDAPNKSRHFGPAQPAEVNHLDRRMAQKLACDPLFTAVMEAFVKNEEVNKLELDEIQKRATKFVVDANAWKEAQAAILGQVESTNVAEYQITYATLGMIPAADKSQPTLVHDPRQEHNGPLYVVTLKDGSVRMLNPDCDMQPVQPITPSADCSTTCNTKTTQPPSGCKSCATTKPPTKAPTPKATCTVGCKNPTAAPPPPTNAPGTNPPPAGGGGSECYDWKTGEKIDCPKS